MGMPPPTTRAFAPLAVLAVLALLLPALTVLPARAGAPPNIVLIVTDDQDFSSLKQMRNVRELIEQPGTSFSNFFVSTPGCCPSRASILRGQYTHNHRVWTSSAPDGGYSTFRDLGHERSTVATWLQAETYRTALVGKYLNEYGEQTATTRVPPGWDEWYASTSIKYFDYDLVENGKLVHYGTDPKDYLTDVLSRKALSFVHRSAQDGKPFFLYLAPRAPHGPATPAPRHEGKFDRVKVSRDGSFNEDDVGDKPDYVRNSPRLTANEIRQLDALHRDRLRTLQAVDEMVGELFQTLRETGALDTTYVFFTSDNGYLLGQHRRAEKGLPYEEAIRVPLLVRGPGVRKGVVERRLASNIDLAPTIAELAGATPRNAVDGRSLVPLLESTPPVRWRQATIVENAGPDEVSALAGDIGTTPNNPPFWALRMEDRVYIESPRTDERELSAPRPRQDPFQLRNLANAAARPDEIAGCHAWLAALRGCAGEGCRDADDALPTGAG